MSFWCHRLDQKSNKNIVRISALEAFWGFLKASLLMVLLTKSHGSPKKLPGSYKKFQGRNPYNIFVAILVQTMTPKDISIFCILNLTFIIKIKTTLRQNSIVVEVQKILRASICQLNNDQSGCTLSLEP